MKEWFQERTFGQAFAFIIACMCFVAGIIGAPNTLLAAFLGPMFVGAGYAMFWAIAKINDLQ